MGPGTSQRPGRRARSSVYESPGALRGQDVDQEVEITLEEAFHGTTRVLQKGNQRLDVKIPAGARTGTRVRLAGQGSSGLGSGQAGDLYLVVKVLPHETFEREGDDLRCELPVDLYTAILGGEAVVRTLEGEVKLKITPETQSGRVFRLAGQGMPRLREPASRGDLRVKVRVMIPQPLTARERELFQELAKLR